MEQREFIVETEAAGQRIDRFLSGEDTGLSRSALQGLVAEGHVLCNGRSIAKSLKLKAGDTILLEIPDAKPIEAVPQDIPLDIVYEDDHLLVVNKPKGMVVHPAPGNPDGTLVNDLLWHCKGSLSGIGGEIRPGIVHRIDKDTSGLLVVAKDDATHIGLSQQMAVHSVERAYQTVVYGGFAQDEGFVAEGHVLCNGKAPAKSLKLKTGDIILLEIPDAKPIEAVPQEIPLDIIYEDAHLLVVNKPKGMVVHPAPGNPDGTLVNALLWHCKGSLSGIGGEIRPGIVHRIDKDTSGLLVVAKDDATHIGLSQQMAVHSVERAYNTIVYGGFAQDEGFVESNLGRSKTDRKKMAVYPASEPHTKYAYTGYKVLERLGEFTMLECRLKTGRTHQIRVHMASIHHPVAGDPVYGPHNCITSLHGQCLHAKTLGFVHPITGEHLRFDSELPDYFTRFLTTLRQRTGGNTL